MKPKENSDKFKCTKCKTEKLRHEFKRNTSRISGYASCCLDCHRLHTANKRKQEKRTAQFNLEDASINLFLLWNSYKGNHG